MNIPIQINDIPAVETENLWLLMQVFIEMERGLVLLRGASPTDLERAEREFWMRFNGDHAEGAAVLVRFHALVVACSGIRLRKLILAKGYHGIRQAVAAAASLRLNAKWGFAPQRLLWAMNRQAQSAEAEPIRVGRPNASRMPALALA